MGGRSYLKTVAMSEIKLVFPFMKERENQKPLLLILTALIFPLILYRAYIQSVIPYVELVVTPKCNLNCEGCANLMPCYDKTAEHIDFDILKSSIDSLFKISKRIEVLKFIGGEPFLYSRLGELVSYAVKNQRVKKIIITTNGSVIPKIELLLKLKDEKVNVDISDYPNIDSKVFVDRLKSNGIKYEKIKFYEWVDYGNTEKRNLSSEALKRSFRECASAECKTILNGKLYACPRAAHGDILGIIPSKKSEIVNILKREVDFKSLYSLSCINACNHCNPVWKRKGIECGKQINQ